MQWAYSFGGVRTHSCPFDLMEKGVSRANATRPDICSQLIAQDFRRQIFVTTSRSQDEGTLLRYINDYNRTIYAFEMLPPPLLDEEVSGNMSDDTSTITTSDATSHGSTGTFVEAQKFPFCLSADCAFCHCEHL